MFTIYIVVLMKWHECYGYMCYIKYRLLLKVGSDMACVRTLAGETTNRDRQTQSLRKSEVYNY